MKATRKTLIALSLTALGIACSNAMAANLIVNGSFEDPVIGAPYYSSISPTGWTKGGSAGDASIWRVGYDEGGGNNVTVAGEGMQFVTMGGGYQASGTTTWSQTVSGLGVGQSYQLDFKIAAEGACCGTQSVVVDFVGSSTAAQTFTASSPAANYWKAWIQQGMLLTADASSVTVRFTYSGPYDMGLDDVSLAGAVPEPGTYALLMAGLGLVGVAARRRQGRTA